MNELNDVSGASASDTNSEQNANLAWLLQVSVEDLPFQLASPLGSPYKFTERIRKALQSLKERCIAEK